MIGTDSHTPNGGGLGGLCIGVFQHDLEVGSAMRNYTLLTIGDGLVAQIPSLVLSTATAIIVTRVSNAEAMSSQVFTQMFDNPRALAVAAAPKGKEKDEMLQQYVKSQM